MFLQKLIELIASIFLFYCMLLGFVVTLLMMSTYFPESGNCGQIAMFFELIKFGLPCNR